MFVNVNGIELFCHEIGTHGHALLLMHGPIGLDHTYFRPWLDPLASRLRLLYYDHRGNGRSTHFDSFAGFDHKTWADDADILRQRLGHDKIVLLGHSAGGFVALEYALRYGRHLKGLILCNTTPAMDYMETMVANTKSGTSPEIFSLLLKILSLPLASNEELRADFLGILPLYFKKYDQEIGSRFVNAIRWNFRAFNYGIQELLPKVNFLADLHRITMPVLIIDGRFDRLMPPHFAGDRLLTAIPHASRTIFENSGHFPFIEEQDLFNKIVTDWCEALPG